MYKYENGLRYIFQTYENLRLIMDNIENIKIEFKTKFESKNCNYEDCDLLGIHPYGNLIKLIFKEFENNNLIEIDLDEIYLESLISLNTED